MRGPATALAADIAAALEELDVPYAVIGATALAVHGVTRGTHDVDFLTTSHSVLSFGWSLRLEPGTTAEVRKGDADDPLAGVVRFARENSMPVDLVVGRWTWQREILERAERRSLGEFEAPVPLAEDLLILKVESGGPLDLRDAMQLVEVHGDDLILAAERRLAGLPEPVRNAWADFRRS